MAESRFHKIKQRRSERAPLTAHGGLNLVPLVDILTSIVFFSLATYTGVALAAMTAFDLSLPPTVVTAPQPVNKGNDAQLTLLLAVRISPDGIRVEHSGGNQPFRQDISGHDQAALNQLRDVLVSVRRSYPDNKDVLVVPDDAVSYDDVVKVLEQARIANFTNIALGNRARSTQVASAGPTVNRGGR
jgi:biopolymer transport protein ExbD